MQFPTETAFEFSWEHISEESTRVNSTEYTETQRPQVSIFPKLDYFRNLQEDALKSQKSIKFCKIAIQRIP